MCYWKLYSSRCEWFVFLSVLGGMCFACFHFFFWKLNQDYIQRQRWETPRNTKSTTSNTGRGVMVNYLDHLMGGFCCGHARGETS